MTAAIATHLPLLFGVILLYRTLGRREREIQRVNQEYKQCESETDPDEDGASESLHLVSTKKLEDSSAYN